MTYLEYRAKLAELTTAHRTLVAALTAEYNAQDRAEQRAERAVERAAKARAARAVYTDKRKLDREVANYLGAWRTLRGTGVIADTVMLFTNGHTPTDLELRALRHACTLDSQYSFDEKSLTIRRL